MQKSEAAKEMRRELAKKLKFLRLKNNYTLSELAKKVNVCASTMSSWEKGRTAPLLNKLVRIAKIYNVRLDDMFCLKDSEKIEAVKKRT